MIIFVLWICSEFPVSVFSLQQSLTTVTSHDNKRFTNHRRVSKSDSIQTCRRSSFAWVAINDFMTNNGLINPIWAWTDWLIIDQTANHCVCFSLSLQKPVMTQGSWGGGWASCDVLTVCETKEIHIYNSRRCWEDGSTHIYFVNCFLVFVIIIVVILQG